ncbi:hypothetical protein GCM10018793_32820 [Streptomyces sulfonofaciens]|uniref:Uncharacterized protein n=1 Tax=Streptomyces sulfonofaciens TaxID=68272 RepID=A0A919G7P7_9ACTN|nr:hypothetical protein GCM10018793_32820 [Streptomyces sulfonofaciens]
MKSQVNNREETIRGPYNSVIEVSMRGLRPPPHSGTGRRWASENGRRGRQGACRTLPGRAEGGGAAACSRPRGGGERAGYRRGVRGGIHAQSVHALPEIPPAARRGRDGGSPAPDPRERRNAFRPRRRPPPNRYRE